MRLHDYLERISAVGPERAALQPTALGADVETLRRVHAAHRETFLFENLTIQTGGRISLALDDLQRKFLDEGRGGDCFEHNTLFAAGLPGGGLKPGAPVSPGRRGAPGAWGLAPQPPRIPDAD